MKYICFAIALLLQACAYDGSTHMHYRFEKYVGEKFDLYEFINMTPDECKKRAEQDVYRAEHHLPRGFALFPWHPLTFRKHCGIRKVAETDDTADYKITYYSQCKYIYTVDKQTDVILSWRYAKNAKNCLSAP